MPRYKYLKDGDTILKTDEMKIVRNGRFVRWFRPKGGWGISKVWGSLEFRRRLR